MYVKGYVATETQSAVERARLLIERAEELGETPEDPLLLFSVLYGFWTASHVDFNGEKMRDLAGQFLGLAEKQGSIAPLMVGHRLMGMSLLQTGDIAQGRAHFDHAIALYNPAEHRPLATLFGVDSGVSILSNRSCALWILGYPAMALADAERALHEAREIGQAAELIYTVTARSVSPDFLWELRGSRRIACERCRAGGRKEGRLSEGTRNDVSRVVCMP